MKIDTHRHFGGSLPTKFVWDVIDKLKLRHIAESLDDVQKQMTFSKNESYSFHKFLDKFRILDNIIWTEDIIDQSIKSVCDELEAENIDYAFLDLSINKYMSIGWHKFEAIKFIYDSFEKYRPGKVGLVLSLKYESMLASNRRYSRLIENDIAKEALVGIDLVGNEELYDDSLWSDLLKDWVSSGKMVRAHVGEFGPESNIKTAIQNLQVTNIAHGIKIRDEELIKEAIDRDISFDLGITSNYLTGVVTDKHPICYMNNNNLKLTIGTDDPVICDTTLDKEILIVESYGIDAIKLVDNAVDMYYKFRRV